MTDKLRVGLIGTGFGTRVHVPAIARRDDVELVAICSARRDRARDFAEQLGIEFYTDDYREIVNAENVDLVDVTTPPDSHMEMSIAALDAGKHVFCEKPIAVNAREAAAMAEAGRRGAERGLVSVVNHELRYLPIRRQIRRLVAEGYIGKPQFVVAAIHVGYGTDPGMEPYYWGWLSKADMGGGALMSMFSHHIDLLRFCFGEIDDVTGRTSTLITERPVLGFEYRDGDPIGPDTETFGVRPVETDDTATLQGVIGDGALLSVTGSWSLQHPSGMRLEAYGDQGSLQLLPDGTLLGGRTGDAGPQVLEPTDLIDPVGDDHYLVPALASLFGEIVAATRGENDHIYATFDDGLRLQQIIDIVKGVGSA
jgi:predicted dehydrogenase